MTVTAYVRNLARGTEERHPLTVQEEPAAPCDPTIVDVPGFGLYAMGVHPELGPLATYVVGTPGVDPEPAPCSVVDGRLEVPLLHDGVLTIVVEGHPMEEGTG